MIWRQSCCELEKSWTWYKRRIRLALSSVTFNASLKSFEGILPRLTESTSRHRNLRFLAIRILDKKCGALAKRNWWKVLIKGNKNFGWLFFSTYDKLSVISKTHQWNYLIQRPIKLIKNGSFVYILTKNESYLDDRCSCSWWYMSKRLYLL